VGVWVDESVSKDSLKKEFFFKVLKIIFRKFWIKFKKPF
jgi:hypothetical protein